MQPKKKFIQREEEEEENITNMQLLVFRFVDKCQTTQNFINTSARF